MEEVDRHESGEGGRRQCDSADESESFVGRSFGAVGRVIGGGCAKINEACGGFDVLKTRAEKPTADSELPELLGIFRLLASRSLLPHDNGVALESLVFPTALSKRRYVRSRQEGIPPQHLSMASVEMVLKDLLRKTEKFEAVPRRRCVPDGKGSGNTEDRTQ